MVLYATREDVMSALESQPSARTAVLIDRALESASRAVEGLLHRKFYPWTGTRKFDWPNDSNGRTGRLWLDDDELISVQLITSGGVEIVSGNYFLEPVNDGPPYDHLDLNRGTNASFSQGNTSQQSISITGVFGYDLDEIAATTLAEALDVSETAVDVADVSQIGIGSILRVEDERMLVTSKSWLSSGQTLQADVTASKSIVSLQVADGAAFHANETVLLDSERMLVIDVAGNTLTVQRAVEGSLLAAHSGVTIYVARTLSVQRGALGTTAATHVSGSSVYVHQVPAPVRELTIAYAIETYEGKKVGYTDPGGGSKDKRAASGSLKTLEADVYARYGRKARIKVV